MTKEEHCALHTLCLSKTLGRPDVLEKLREIRQRPEFKERIRQKMLAMHEELSQRAKAQWENEEYKQFMIGKFLDFYHSNAQYRETTLERLNTIQKEYWSSKNSLCVCNSFSKTILKRG